MVLGLVFCAPGAPLCGNAEPAPTPTGALTVHVEGASRQGGALFVTVEGAPADARLRWLGKMYDLGARDASRARGALPVPTTASPGGHAVEVVDAAGHTLASQSVTVARHHFGYQSISLPAAMLASYDTPQAKADDKLVIDAMVFSPEKWWRGNFIEPVQARHSTSFGMRRTYNGWRKDWHRGVDFEVGNGTPVRATNAGVVGITAPHQVVNGNAVVLNHGLGISSLYMHFSRILVHRGEHVDKGQIIGYSGHSGAGTGPHLHWACYVHATAIDPAVLENLPVGWR
jgi:murein DD-endopeptidase MepM/ murein hydrolase activator NlpD